MNSRLAALAVAILLTVTAACSGGGSSSSAGKSSSAASEPLTPPAGFNQLGPTDTAAALVDPSRVRLGVWSLLDHLGVGVYTGDGKQVLAGSERSEKDFWLYDFEIPVLERMATAPPIPFSEYADYLHAHGVTATVDEVLAGYASAYAKHPDAFLVQLFNASKVQFTGAPSISPLTEWLLLLDATVSPNGQPAQGSSLGRASRVTPVALAQERCSLDGDGRAAGFGIARSESDRISMAYAEAVAELPAQAMLIANSIDVTVLSDPNEVHEGHDGPGARESIDATAQVGVVPVVVNCGSLFGLLGNIYSLRGPLAGVKLTWNASPEASEHGTLNVGGDAVNETTSTDRDGRSHVSLDTREEPSKGKGDPHDLTANVFVRADVRTALLAAQVSRVLVDLVPSQVAVRGMATFRISWHDDSHHWTGTITSSSDDTLIAPSDAAGLVCSATWKTDLSLAVDANGKITGTAIATMQGPPVCPRPDFIPQTPQVIHAPVTGTASDQQLHFELSPHATFEPSAAAPTGLVESFYRGGTSPASFDVPVTSKGKAAGDVPLRFTIGTNQFSSENSIVLSCTDC